MNDGSVGDDSVEVADALRRELSLGADVTRFAAGSVPVFAVGNEHVVKLFPSTESAFFDTERAALARIDGQLSIPTPRLLAAGERGQWLYVVMTRLHGRSLAEVWVDIGSRDRRQLMTEVGVALAELHAVAHDGLATLAIDWPRFVSAQRASCRARQLAKGLGDPWLDLVDEFLASRTPADDGARALLHTEVMREHLLVEQRAAGWHISGLVDFEPAMLGAPEYEFASVGVFVTGAEPGLLGALLEAYGAKFDEERPQRIMAYALLHRYSNLRWYLERLPAPGHVRDLEQLARQWFVA